MNTYPVVYPTQATFQPPQWKPAPYGPGPSPFMAKPRPKRLGQIFGSQSLFDHPAIGLAIDAGAISVAFLGTRKFTGTWRIVSWALLVASGIKAVNDAVRLMTMPGPTPMPAPEKPPIEATPTP